MLLVRRKSFSYGLKRSIFAIESIAAGLCENKTVYEELLRIAEPALESVRSIASCVINNKARLNFLEVFTISNT